MAHANYECEIDVSHPTFIRKKSDKKYTEPHHLIPMAFSDEFDVSLDVEENIVSLCSNCHNQIHYGKDADVLLRKLYEERKDELLYCMKYGSYEVESVMGLSPSAIIEKDFEYIDDKLVEALLMAKVLAEKIAGKAILELI